MERKVIIECSMNETPEYRINERLKKLGKKWTIISATTQLIDHGNMSNDNFSNVAYHIYYVTTMIVEKIS